MILKTNLFKIKHSTLLPNCGTVLISEPFLHEVYFQRATVLMIEFHNGGGMGIVTNKTSHMKLNDFVEGLDEVESIPLFWGGPVRQDKLFYLHTLGEMLPGAKKIGENLYIDGDFDTLINYIKSGNPIEGEVRFFLGYTGWDPEQLSKEIEEDTWIVADPDTLELLRSQGDLSWREMLLSLEKPYQQWLNYPPQPYLN